MLENICAFCCDKPCCAPPADFDVRLCVSCFRYYARGLSYYNGLSPSDQTVFGGGPPLTSRLVVEGMLRA